MSILIKNFQFKKRYQVAFLLGISAIVGIMRFIVYLIPRSKPESQLIWGLSAARFFLGIVFLGLLLINIGAVIFALKDFFPAEKKIEKKLNDIFVNHHTVIMLILYGVFALIGTLFLLVIPPIIRPLRFLEPFYLRLNVFFSWILIADLLLIISLYIVAPKILRKSQSMAKLNTFFASVGIFVLTFVLYLQFAILIGWINKTTYSFFDLLAEQFVNGKLYLENPPYTHDLTLYKGKWYVPMPPLPAILLMPFAYFVGAADISTSYLSMLASAFNGVLLFLILKEMNIRQWIKLSKTGIYTLVVLFLFGTPHFWLGISGRGWYFSQILTVLFVALAVYAALRSWSAWWIGVFVGLAIMTRPTAMMTTPFLLAITMQIRQEKQKKLEFKPIFLWVLKAAVPITLAIASLLFYNYLRFENIFDFGYVTVNAGPDIVANVQKWGTFSTHFIPINLSVMFFKLPFWNPGGRWPILPSATGMSIFLTTPALIYLFRRYPKDWWVIGAWTSVFLSAGLMILYHNTGAHQFGYRYILDFIIPLTILLGISLKKKIPWHFIALTLLSIAINLYGADWFMNG